MALEPRHWLAALAILFVFFAPYQTLVQTVITDDAVRLGIEADEYDMTWVTVAYGVGVIYGVFAGIVVVAPDRQAVHAGPGHARVLRRQRPLRRGDRARSAWPSPGSSRGSARCWRWRSAAPRSTSSSTTLCWWPSASTACSPTRRGTSRRSSTRTSTCTCRGGGCTGPTCRSALIAAALVWRFIRPDRPPQPVHVPIDWLAVTTFVAWIVAIVFAFAWYRKWGGWSSNEFVVTVVLCVALPVVLVAWLGSGFSPDEHLKPDPPLAGLRALP